MRPLPALDGDAAPYFAAAATGSLAIARCSRCRRFAHPPDVVCPNCGHTDPRFEFEPVAGGGTVRSWTVLRQSFLPGFEDDLPFVLVDVELDVQDDLRLIGRLVDGVDAPVALGARVTIAFEQVADGVAVPAFALELPGMSPTFPARSQVAVVGYAQSEVVRHFGRPLGAVAVDTARAAIADAGLTPERVDGFVGSSMFPSAGSHAARDGISMITPNWLAQHLGIDPRYATGFQGFGQLPGSVALAVNALTSGAADHVLLHRALHNPAGRYHGRSSNDLGGLDPWTAPQGFFGPLAMIGMATNEYAQRYGATREDLAAIVVEARKNGARIPWSYWHGKPLTVDEYLDAPLIADPIGRFDCDIPVDGVATFVLTTAERARDLPNRPVYVAGYASGAPSRPRLQLHWPLDDVYEVGLRLADRLWASAGIDASDVDLPQLYDGFSPFVWMWLEVLGLCPVGEAHRFIAKGGIDSDDPTALPALSGGGALGNGRMHGVPQMLECYLQLSGRAGERQRDAHVGLACHSSPHYGGAVAYSNEPIT